jgi:hypothetical protein
MADVVSAFIDYQPAIPVKRQLSDEAIKDTVTQATSSTGASDQPPEVVPEIDTEQESNGKVSGGICLEKLLAKNEHVGITATKAATDETMKAEKRKRKTDLQSTTEVPVASTQPTKCERKGRKNGNSDTKELLYTSSLYKRRFCAYYPDTEKCKRGADCAFAHSREEYRGSLLPAEEEHEGWHSDDFYMTAFKTLWCPLRKQHDWRNCVYAHNYLDIRRRPEIGYGPQACPHWDSSSHLATYEAGCPQGIHCPYSHGAKEQLYHPASFKTVLCWDNLSPEGCPRSSSCVFFHNEKESRVEVAEGMSYDYDKLLDEKEVEKLQAEFLAPRPSLSEIPERKKAAKPSRKKDAASAPPATLVSSEASQVPCVMVPVPVMIPAPMAQLAMQYQMMAMQYQMMALQG